MNTSLFSNRGRRRQRRSGGQALVEFALVIPIFLLLLAGMVDFGVGLYSNMTLNNATRDGARFASTNCDAIACVEAVKEHVAGASNGLLSASNVTSVICYQKPVPPSTTETVVTCQPKSSTQAGVQKGDRVAVTTNYSYHMLWPLAFGTTIPMGATATFMIE